MPLILSLPASGPTAPASTGNRAVARSDDQDTAQPGSFGEAMARSHKNGFETAAEPAVRTAPAKVVRRLPDADETTAKGGHSPDLILLIPLEARQASIASAVNLSGNCAATGPTQASEIQADSEMTGLTNLLAPALALSYGLVNASGSMTNTQAVAAPASGLAANATKDFDTAPAKSKATLAGDGMALAADSQAITALSDTAGKGLSDPSFGQAGESSNRLAEVPERRVDQPLTTDSVPFAGTGTLALPAGAMMQQPGSAFAPSVPAPTMSVILLPEVGSNEWGKALSQQVIHLSTGDRQMAELELNPPGLGPLKVTLSVSDQQMQAAFVSAHSSVRAAVETALPQLRALLAESGISLGQTSVGAESQSQTAFANSQGSFTNQSPRQAYPGSNAGMADPLSDQPTEVKRRSGQGLRIDTYA